MIRAGIITVSTKGALGKRVDESGPAMHEMLVTAGHSVVHQALVPDEVEAIATAILAAVHARANVVLTTGGTGAGGTSGLSVPVMSLWARPPAVNSRLRMMPTWAPRSICCPPPARFPRAGMMPSELSGASIVSSMSCMS